MDSNELKSWLPEGEENVFQRVKKETKKAEKEGIKLWPLTIGQPTGPAFLSARNMAAMTILSDNEAVHEYQDNGSPGIPDFARRFVLTHFPADIAEKIAKFSFLPIPGIKPMLILIPMACGHIHVRGAGRPLFNDSVVVGTMTEPGYPTPGNWCDYLGVENYALKTTIENGFVFSVDDINKNATLLMLNYPHNPTGVTVDENFWLGICDFCQERGIRLFNDAAYASLVFYESACMLAKVAPNFPKLSWCEAYSASKAVGNATGWRAGAMVGSKDFISDIATMKGNIDSGLMAAAAAGVLYSMENDMPSVVENKNVYMGRTAFLVNKLESFGMVPAAYPSATFFSTWATPWKAFGEKIENAEHFNKLLMYETGVYGIPFGNLLRLTVTKPVNSSEWAKAIKSAFSIADVEY